MCQFAARHDTANFFSLWLNCPLERKSTFWQNDPMTKHLSPIIGSIAAFWGIVGASAILLMAVGRMFKHVIEGFGYTLEIQHYALLIPWLFFMVYSEGYKGFQKGFSPRVAARACYLKNNATWLRAILAPLFCMGFFGSTRKRKIVIFCLLTAITSFVILFQYVPQPWRGVLDVGVVAGLSYGIIATWVFFLRYWFGSGEMADPEIP